MKKAKLPSTNILAKSIINDIGFTNYNLNIKKLYEAVFVNDTMNVNHDNVFDKVFLKYLHFKYDSSKMTHDEFTEAMKIDKGRMILKLVNKMDTQDLSLYSVIKAINQYAFEKDDITVKIYDIMNGIMNSKLLELKKKILSQNAENVYMNNEPKQLIIDKFLEIFKKHIDLYNDIENSETSEILSKMIELDNMNLFTSSLLLMKNDFIDFTKFDKSVTNYIDLYDGIVNRNKCSKYYLSKQYHTMEQLELDNSKIIFFDKEFDKTNYNLFNEEQLENRQECMSVLMNKYRFSEKEANFEYESILKKSREVREGDFALLYANGEFLMFKRNKKNVWEATKEFSGMSGKEIFCNIQSDCFALPSNNCSNIKDKQKLNTVQDVKDSINDFDKDIIIEKAVFKEIMLKQLEQNVLQLTLIKQKQENHAFKQSRLLYNIGIQYVPSDIDESPYIDIFHSILEIKDLDLKYKYLIKFCANFTRDANILVESESPHWKYCIKTNIKLVRFYTN